VSAADASRADATIEVDAAIELDASANEDAATHPDASLGEWITAPELARGPRQETAVVALAGEVVVIGGFDGQGTIVATVEAFDPETNMWRELAALPQAVHHANAAVIGERLFVLGALGELFGALRVAWEYDAANDMWIDRTPIANARRRGSSAVVPFNGSIWILGGYRNGTVGEVDRYDPALDMWFEEPDLPRITEHVVAGVIGEKIYLAGGRANSITGHTGRLDIYESGTGWSEGPTMPTPRGGAAAAVLFDRLYVFGGEGNTGEASGVFDAVEAFDPALDAWIPRLPMQTPRHGTGAAAVGDRIYVPGGADVQAFSAVSTVEIFVP
jgi:N-acetylneuraminic acid mutarotase